MITADQLKQLLSYDPATGIFTWRVRRNQNAIVGSVAGAVNTGGYIQIRVLGRKYAASHLAFLYMTGGWPIDQIDHINREPADNRWANLREASHAENCMNRRTRSDNTSGIKGVKQTRFGTYEASIGYHGEKIYLGTFPTLVQALSVRRTAERDLHGKFAGA